MRRYARHRVCTLILVVTLGVLTSSANRADAADITQELDQFRAPTTPAFTLLNVQPSSVERPSTGHALIASLVSAASESNGQIPENYALEVAPYWLSLRRLKYSELYGGLRSIPHTLGISFATQQIDGSDSTSTNTRIALGMRTLLLALETPGVRRERDRLTTELETLDAERLKPPSQRRVGLDEQIDAKVKEIQSTYSKRLLVEFAGGLGAEFPERVADRGRIFNTGVWLTVSYSMGEDLDLLAVGRYRRDAIPQGGTESIEGGGRLLWTKGSLGLSAEAVARNPTQDDAISSNRLAGILEYQLTSSLYLSATFGRDFATAEDRHPLLSLLGLNWGLGPKSSISTDK